MWAGEWYDIFTITVHVYGKGDKDEQASKTAEPAHFKLSALHDVHRYLYRYNILSHSHYYKDDIYKISVYGKGYKDE